MILVDTSVWVEHFRQGLDPLSEALERGEVCVHDFVVGELACGFLPKRAEVLEAMQLLPSARAVNSKEFLCFIEARDLMGKGMGFVDLHLLAATCIMPGLLLWTFDRRLGKAASALNAAISFP